MDWMQFRNICIVKWGDFWKSKLGANDMKWLTDLFSNPFLMAGISAWVVAQVLKGLIYWAVNRKFDIHRLFGDGGMPSGHSATVTSVAITTALLYGCGSFEFAISAILAIIVCHDAMGVRLETGKQAAVINELVKSFEVWNSQKLPEVKLKEFVGHSPIQVLAGILVGIVNATVIYLFFL
jgi:hypothetical protein